MNVITRRIAAGATLAVAPVLIAFGAASAGHAETTPSSTGPSVSAPAHKLPTEPGVPNYLHPNRHHHNNVNAH